MFFGCADSGGSSDGSGGGPSTQRSTAGDGGAGTASGSGGATQAGAGGATSATSATSSDGATTGAGSTTGGSNGLPTLGTLVVLGDSISDGGGQGPFYYDVLRQKLEAHYGQIAYQNRAESGSKTGALGGQIGDLPNQLPGPIAVAITSGGNDMKAALPLIVAGVDAGARQTMGQNIDGALEDLLAPGRFGAGVEVFVFEADIYDASDGVGDFGSHGCAFGQGLPTIPTDDFFAAWNGEIEARVAGRGQTLMDIHAVFHGHGYAGNPSWYASDCTHPNSSGHSALADYFYSTITGS
jgi:lysophospholipase L1-like esterase